ncbi:Cationic peroxidase 1-like protein [Drosera capensis]
MVTVWLVLFGAASAQLTSTYYASTCPKALSTIRTVVKAAIAKEARMGASLLRLHFHDCFGCDASVLLDDTSNFTGEKTAAPNLNSLRGFDVIDTIKSSVESVCPGVVSCADILAVVARDSVVKLGGPKWTVLLGRRDSTTANLSAVTANIPAPTFNLSALISSFSNKGLSAHTIGLARCVNFRSRIYNETNINSSYKASLQAICPSSSSGGNNTAPLDTVSPTAFDSSYFKDLIHLKGLLHSDQQLYNGGSTDSKVTTYGASRTTFFKDFASAMIKMGNLSPLTGSSGQVRTNCRKINS